MPNPIVTWDDPTNLNYDHIEVFVKVNAGNPADPTDYVQDVAIGVEQYVDPVSYVDTDVICYGLKAVIANGSKSPFATFVCVRFGGPALSVGVDPYQLVLTAYQPSVSVTAGSEFNLSIGTVPALLKLTGYQAIILSTSLDIRPGGFASLALTGYQAASAPQPAAMPLGTTTLALTGYQAAAALGVVGFTPDAATLALTGYQVTIAPVAAPFSPGVALMALTSYRVTTAQPPFQPFTANLDLISYVAVVALTERTLAAGTTALALTGYQAAAAFAAVELAPGVAALALTGYQVAVAPTVTGFAAGTTALAITGYQATTTPTVLGLAPGSAALVLTGYQPSIDPQPAFVLSPTRALLQVTGYPAIVTGQSELLTLEGGGIVELEGGGGILLEQGLINLGSRNLTLVSYGPTVTPGLTGFAPGSASLSLVGFQPSMGLLALEGGGTVELEGGGGVELEQ